MADERDADRIAVAIVTPHMEITQSIPTNLLIFIGIAIGIFLVWIACALLFGRRRGGD